MLKSIKITNFRSIGDQQELSFNILPKDNLDHSSIKINDKSYLNLVSCIIGTNASGKTNILKSLHFIIPFMFLSYGKDNDFIPIKTHKLKEKESTLFEIEFFDNKKLFKYSLELNQKEVLRESFYENIKRDFSYIFKFNEKNDNKIIFNPEWKKSNKININSGDKERFEKLRQSSVLSGLIKTRYLPEYLLFKNFVSNLSSKNHNSVFDFVEISKKLQSDENLANKVLDFTKEIDLGISNFSYKDIEFREDFKFPMLQCEHKSKKKSFRLSLSEESHGTKNSVYILSELLPLLKEGGVAILDEFDAELHPHIAKKIISLFEDKEINIGKAQIIFSTHQHLLLQDRTKTQIFIVEKSKDNFETEIYCLDDVEKVRNDENYVQKYLAGTYGGIPNIESF